MERLYLSGEGDLLTKISGGSLLKFGTIQNITFTTTATFKELFAGRGLFPVVSRAFDKSIEVTCEMASFDKDFIELSQGLDPSAVTTIERWKPDEKQTVPDDPGPYAVNVDKGNYRANYTYVTDENGNRLIKVDGAPASGEYQESNPATGELTFNADMAGKDVFISYVYEYNMVANPDTVEALPVLADILPANFELYYRSTLTESGRERGIEIIFWKCQSRTDLKLSFARDFTVPNFTFRVMDPKRPDGRIGHYILL